MGKKKAKGVFGGEDLSKDEAPLQAVLLADSFEQTFRPISLEMPKALLPLANVPLIEYSLEFLAEAGIKEIFVICGWLGDKVQEYLNHSRWSNSEDPKVHVIRASGATNACHAIRELDGMDKLRSDPFVLVSGDVVSNIKLKPILDAHKARRKSKDGGRNNIMTMVFSSIDQVKNRIRPLTEELAVVMDRETKQILKYENDLGSKSVNFTNAELFSEHPSVEYCYNLLDCNIDICSPEMVAQIAENYDYKDLRQDYVRNEVQNREYGYKIHAHVLTSPSDYACRVRCLRTYDAISKDLVRRWLYPLVPDANWVSESTSYAFERGFRYRDEGVEIARSSQVGENTMLGADCKISENAIVESSILGPGCVIGPGAVVVGSYLWTGVEVQEGARVTSAVLCDSVVVEKKAVVNRGCVLSYNVRIGAGFETAPFTRITTSTKKDEDVEEGSDFGDFSDEDESDAGDSFSDHMSRRKGSSTSEPLPVDESVVGKQGAGVRWVKHTSTLSRLLDVPKWAESSFTQFLGDLQDRELAFMEVSGGIGCSELEKVREAMWSDLGELKIDDDEEDEDELTGEGTQGSHGGSDDMRLLQFVAELLGGVAESGNVEHGNVVLELNGQKFAQNRSFEEILYAVVPCMIGEAAEGAMSRDQAVKRVTEKLDIWQPTLEKMSMEDSHETAILCAVELVLLYGQKVAGFAGLQLHARTLNAPDLELAENCQYARDGFPMILSHMFLKGMVSAQAIQDWLAGHATTKLPSIILKDANLQLVLGQLLAESDSEDDDDEEDDDDDEEEDEDEE